LIKIDKLHFRLDPPDGGLQIDRDIPVGGDARQLSRGRRSNSPPICRQDRAQSSALVDVPPPARH
jgi:hypothetical protein